ncbi:alpha-L-arabinofuranosidase B [Amycolatopsis vancoresmycina]|uniref:alpha-L-arabinofuranosidase B n=1 Tax=Amycolatopsis vancoresmycina TaxID=208444 RepID=UPI000525F7C9|nr:alpha-L-arabinofuranosidase B [Amycolatopsis vancoresmycina]
MARQPRTPRVIASAVLAAGTLVAGLLAGGGTSQAATQGPCDIYAAGGTPCVAAHSTTRALYGAYNGPLYQVRRASDSATRDIGVLSAGGVANAATQDSFCAGTTCLITVIYDQSGRNNRLTQAPPGGFQGPAAGGYDNLANATAAPITVGGHKAYGVYVAPGTGYRNNNTNGIATGDQPEGMYAIFDGTHYNGGCCFDYGNAERNSRDNGNGTMEAIYFGNIKVWGYGAGNGPWPMKKEGAIILGIGGDNSVGARGTFYEGVMTSGYPSDATESAVQANITAAGYATSSAGTGLTPGTSVSLRATTACCTDRYIHHTGSTVDTAVIGSGSSATEKGNASWTVRTGLGSSSCVSFESKNVPGQYLRHQNYELYLQANDGSSLFAQDATFCPEAGHNGQGASLRSLNFPDRYVRHYANIVYIAANGGSNTFDNANAYNDDVSWLVSSPWS